MKSTYLLLIALATSTSLFAQDKKEDPKKKDDGKEKKSLIDKAEKIGQDLIAQKETVDTMAGRFVQDKLSIVVPPIWKDKGTMLFNDLKLTKTDKDPLNASLPMPEKGLVQGLNLTINSIPKSMEDKKQQVIGQVKTHLTAFYKEAGVSKSAKEIAEEANGMVTGPEKFTTDQGKTGDLYFIHDIQVQQSSYTVLMLLPAAIPQDCHFVQFQYYKYIYETTFPEELMEWRLFLYPDDQQTYVDFTKKMLKTLRIK